MDDMPGLGARWLTSKEAAALLRVHPKHIYRLLRKGLPAQRVGGQWRFRAAEIERWTRGEPAWGSAGTSGNKRPHGPGEQEVDAALLLSRDDVAVHALVAELNRRAPPAVGIVPHDDARTLGWLEDPRILAAAVLGDLATSSPIQLAWLHIAHEQFGLVGPAQGPPPDPATMLRRKVRVAGWPPGSDLRAVVDGALSRDGIDSRRAHASAMSCSSHADVVSAVVRGDAQIGVTTAAWAMRFGLPFWPLGSRPIGLVAPASALGHPALVRCWEVLQTLEFLHTLERAGGYDAADAGVIRYLRPGPSPLPSPSRSRTSPERTRWAIVVRDRGHDASGPMLRAIARLRKDGVRVGGFVQVPKRDRSRVVGYDLRRLNGNTRLPLARRGAPTGSGPVLPYRSFLFHEDAFSKARDWLTGDARSADVLVIDSVSTRESEGGGHFEALAFASRLTTSALVLACVRRDRIATIVDRLGLADRLVALLEAPTDASGEEAFKASIASAARGQETLRDAKRR